MWAPCFFFGLFYEFYKVLHVYKCVYLSGTLEQLAHTLHRFPFWFSIYGTPTQHIFQARQNSVVLVMFPLTICFSPIVWYSQRILNAFFSGKISHKVVSIHSFLYFRGIFWSKLYSLDLKRLKTIWKVILFINRLNIHTYLKQQNQYVIIVIIPL
jgi:hypothetical protein